MRCTRCDFSYTLQHSKTYSLRGRSQQILESTTVEEYSYVYTGGKLMQMVLKTTTTPVDGDAANPFNISIMGNMSFYNAPQADDLHGTGYQVGGAVGNGNAVAIDYNIVPNKDGDPYSGVTISAGTGSTDFHGTMSVTSGLFASPVSVYELIEAAYNGFWGR